MKKLFITLSLLTLIFTGCAAKGAAPETINLAVMKGPTGIGAVQLMETGDYNITLADTPEQVVALLSNGGADIAALPTNLAANLYAKTGGEIRMAAVTAYGMLYLLEEGTGIHSWEDLQGETIYATGRGANPEYVIDYLLKSHQVDATVEYKGEHAELATLMAAGEVKLGLLPEPFVTSAMMQNDQLRVIFDLSEEWDALGSQGGMAMTCLVVRQAFAEQYPQTIRQALSDTEASIKFALENVEQAAQLCEKHGVIPKAAIAARAIPRCNLTFVAGADMRPAVEGFFEVLFDANPQAVGGALPDEDFYYIP